MGNVLRHERSGLRLAREIEGTQIADAPADTFRLSGYPAVLPFRQVKAWRHSRSVIAKARRNMRRLGHPVMRSLHAPPVLADPDQTDGAFGGSALPPTAHLAVDAGIGLHAVARLQRGQCGESGRGLSGSDCVGIAARLARKERQQKNAGK